MIFTHPKTKVKEKIKIKSLQMDHMIVGDTIKTLFLQMLKPSLNWSFIRLSRLLETSSINFKKSMAIIKICLLKLVMKCKKF